MEETELVKRMIDGDMDAFDRLMEIYQPKALRVAYLISASYADSEDIVQETFVACYLNRHGLKNPEAFKGWFYKTLSRNAWRVCRKKKREQPAEEIYPEEIEAPGEILSEIVMKEEETLIYEAICSLPVKHRTVLVLYYYNQMSIKEIAKVCGCLEGTVKSRLHHAKMKLKEILEQEESKGGSAWTILS
ncbi:MAG: RNA polymerase sigma factor [Lachnospiraceae bacterium]|nr:RNA polymerase sigma factor [Lachnospiraceae bacterium]